MQKVDYNLIRKADSKLIRTWNMDIEYKDKIHLVFNNDMAQIESGEYTVFIGSLPAYFEVDINGNIVELTPPEEVANGVNI